MYREWKYGGNRGWTIDLGAVDVAADSERRALEGRRLHIANTNSVGVANIRNVRI